MPQSIRSAAPLARRLTAGAAVLLLSLGASACGGGSDAVEADSTPAAAAPGTAEPGPVPVTQTDFAIDLPEATFAAGEYVFEVVNDGSSTHDLVIARDGEVVAGTQGADPGGTSTLSVTLEPGEYVLYCSIANHREMGMETTIEVT